MCYHNGEGWHGGEGSLMEPGQQGILTELNDHILPSF